MWRLGFGVWIWISAWGGFIGGTREESGAGKMGEAACNVGWAGARL